MFGRLVADGPRKDEGEVVFCQRDQHEARAAPFSLPLLHVPFHSRLASCVLFLHPFMEYGALAKDGPGSSSNDMIFVTGSEDNSLRVIVPEFSFHVK